MQNPFWCSLFGGLEPVLGNFGLDDVIGGSGVAVPKLRHIEADDVEPFRCRRTVPGLVFGGRAFVGHRRDLTSRAAYVLRSAGVENHRKLAYYHRVADLELRLSGLTGIHLWIALADCALVMLVALDLRPGAFGLRLGL